MIDRRIRRGASITAATALLAAALLGPTSVGAAVPAAHTEATAIPSTVLNGETGAFLVEFWNDDSSTIAKLYLDATITGGTYLNAYPSQGSCTFGAVLECDLGQVRSGSNGYVSVLLTYTASDDATAVDGAFEFSTTGLGSSVEGDNSHGDSWTDSASASLTHDPDFGGRFIDGSNLVVQNYQVVGDGNPHATKVYAPQSFIGVTVEDGAGNGSCNAAFVDCTRLFGEASFVNVADGGTFEGGFRIVITMDSSEIPAGVNANNVSIYHYYDGGEELITDRCTFAKHSSTPESLPCLTVKKLPGGDLQITIWTEHNGVLRGYK